MTEDSTPQQLALKQLTVKYEDLEDTVEVLNSFFAQLDANQQENMCNLEKLEKRVAQFETELEKTELLEERVSVLNIQNIELRNHLNLTVDTFNNVVKILNSQVINEEPTDEAPEASTPLQENPDGYSSNEDINEDTQPTVKQVYTMYQTQSPDEEVWDEMTSAIKAAEEYEARKKVNGLTNNEWKDLLRI